MSDHPAAAAASWRSAHRPWSLIDSKCLIGDLDNATTAHAVTSQRNDIKVTFELADPPGVSRCFVHFPGLAEGRYTGEPVVVSSADAFVLLVVPFTDGSEHKDFIVYRAERKSRSRLSPVAPPPPQRRDHTFIPAPAPRPVRIYVVFYSTYGHVRRLARAVQRGVGSVPGALGILLRVPETLPDAVLSRMGALEAAVEMDAEGIPVADPGGLPDADGFLFGFPARYGAMAEQMQAFFDSTAPLCRGQRLAGKPAGFFVSTGTQCGGQETTA
ncbi:putative NAD(P)H dehydrogenase (quinone) FQR1-like 1 [Hordeum vulgare]|nr:putative NAD(P)H dehydrogenase (quinone) FQR1-like 1 [Hordeum vulgare]